MADWRQVYSAAMVEKDPTLLDLVIEEAMQAMQTRLRELTNMTGGNGVGATEKKAITAARNNLQILKAERAQIRLENDQTS